MCVQMQHVHSIAGKKQFLSRDQITKVTVCTSNMSVDLRHGENQTSKQRRTGRLRSRGVSNLTPEQLQKKRASDREAQRVVRNRTRSQIEAFEKRIQELKSQQPYQELQLALQQKERIEAENRQLQQQLSRIIAIVQPSVAETAVSTAGTCLVKIAQ